MVSFLFVSCTFSLRILSYTMINYWYPFSSRNRYWYLRYTKSQNKPLFSNILICLIVKNEGHNRFYTTLTGRLVRTDDLNVWLFYKKPLFIFRNF